MIAFTQSESISTPTAAKRTCATSSGWPYRLTRSIAAIVLEARGVAVRVVEVGLERVCRPLVAEESVR
eukprot:3667523-Prymnesium_polylepis.1